MNENLINAHVDMAKKHIADIKHNNALLAVFFRNTAIPLKVRWDLFKESGLGTISKYLNRAPDAVRKLSVDKERYATIDFETALECYDEDALELTPTITDSTPLHGNVLYSDDRSLSNAEVISIIEYALSTMTRGFVNDW